MNNIQVAKTQPRAFLSIFLLFSQFQPGVAYESVDFKKGYVFKAKNKNFQSRIM